MSSPKQSSEFVWTYFYNGTGWTSAGVVFLTGLSNPAFAYSGIDGAIHLAEDCANAAVAIPRALMGVIVIGFVTSLTFCVSMLYSTSDFEGVGMSILPLFEIWLQATNTKAAIAFMIMVTIMAIFAINAAIQTASRLTWSFARDEALVGSKFIGRVNPSLGVPVWALIFNQIIALLIGITYLKATTAFAAIISSGLVLQQVCFCIPIVLLMMKGRSSSYLPSQGFRLGVAGWLFNSIAVVWTIVQTIFFNFPIFQPVTQDTMSKQTFQSI